MNRRHWTNESCIEIAKQYISLTSFQREWPGCYKYAYKNNLLETFDWMIKYRKKRGYWTYNKCYQEALKYETRNEFRIKGGGAYNKSICNGWINDFTWLKYSKKPNGYWNVYEHCLNASKKCVSHREFCKMTSSGYMNSIKNGWINDFTWLNDKQHSDYEDLLTKVYLIYCYIDSDNKSVYVGLTNNIKQRHLRHKRFDKRRGKYSSVTEHFISIGKELPQPTILEENLNVTQAQEKEDYWRKYYEKNGWHVLNIAKTGKGSSSIGGGFVKWTKSKCYEAAKDCTSIVEMQKKYYGAYRNALHFGWLNEYEWFITYSKPKNYWNYEHCKEESKKYKSKSEFSVKCNGAYRSSRINKWLDEFYPKENKINNKKIYEISRK